MKNNTQETKPKFKISTGNIIIDRDQPLWDKLIQEIIKGNVIPVIGADLLIDYNKDLHKVVLDAVSDALYIKKEFDSFSDLLYSPEYRIKYSTAEIYSYTCQTLDQLDFAPSKRLHKLLSTKQFPFIITTSFTQVVENVMRDIWGKDLKVMNFRNDPKQNDDIIDEPYLRRPTVYYMFGKVSREFGSYVLSDTDLMDYVSSWNIPGEKRPEKLCDALKNKYLLMLGNTYSDWLFRFIWYSIRDKGKVVGGMFAYDRIDDPLINFLQRKDTFTKENTTYVIDQIIERLEKKLQETSLYKFNRPEEGTDIFISYSRSDSDIAERLYNVLSAQGKRVWYDKKNITIGGKFMDEIDRAIHTTKYFIPILTPNIEREKNDSHVYRNEWNTALKMATSMGRTFIIPFVEKGFNFYRAAIPSLLQQHNAVFYSQEESIDEAVKDIIYKINQD